MDVVGAGTYGEVYHDKSSGEAIKKCFHEDTRNVWAGNIREMDILRRCGSHPNIVSLYGVQVNNIKNIKYNKLSLRLKYYPTNLEKFASTYKNGRIDITTIRIITAQLLIGLEYLHANKIIHRDLKPDNILINPTNLEVAICDFGMSEIIMRYKKSDPKVTAPLYRAPEVFRERYYSDEVDLWAVGLVLFWMIYGEYPYNYPLEKEKKMTKQIETLTKKLKKCRSSEKKVIQKDIQEIKESITNMILDEISKIDIKKTFSSRLGFRKLLEGLLQEDPNKRLTATKALEDPFFDPVRIKYIDSVRQEFKPLPIKLQKLSIEGLPERKWIQKYTLKYATDFKEYDIYPIIFHGLDIFEKYLHFCRDRDHEKDRTTGKYLNESEVFLYLYTCFYLVHKFYAVTEVALDFEEFFPEELLNDQNMCKAEEFEEFMIFKVLDFRIFNYTLYEITEEMLNNPIDNDYYKILNEYLNITQSVTEIKNYNSYRDLYRQHIMHKCRMD